ncbi:MAG: metallophosphoesterase family protein [Acidimicrobiales bacterium]
MIPPQAPSQADGVRLLLFSDLHLDTPFRWASPDASRRRRVLLRQTLSRIVELAQRLDVAALCCGGDLFEHERLSPDTGEFLRTTFAAVAPLPVLIAPGNHDWYGPASLYQRMVWSPNVHIFSDDHLSPFSLVDGLTIWGAAHRAPARTENFLDGFGPDRGGIHLGLFHGSEQAGLSFQESGKVPHAPFRADQIPNAGLHHALLGHFHSPADGEWHTYPGNPDPLEFGEQGRRGAVLLTVGGDGRVQRQRHDVASSQVSDVTVMLDGLAHSGQIPDRVRQALAECRGWVRVTLSGTVHPDLDLRPEDIRSEAVAPHLDGMVVRLGNVSTAYDFDRVAREPTVRGRFVRDVVSDTGLDSHHRRRILITGLRALEGRSDLEVH